MGLFGGGTIIKVASSIYNMAGDEKDRPIFLQNLIIRNILSGTKRSMGDTITTGYLNGPGIKYRTFFRWAVENYDLIGMPTGRMYSGDIINTFTVANHIPAAANETIWVQEARLDDGDFQEWAEQWMILNYPTELATAWEADMDDDTFLITITRAGGSTHTFMPVNFEPGAKYIYALFTRSVNGTTDVVEEGTLIPLVPGEAFPPVTAYSFVEETIVTRSETLTTTVETTVTYSDARPDETSSTTSTETIPVDRHTRIYSRQEFIGNDPVRDAKVIMKYIRNLFEDKKIKSNFSTVVTEEEIGGGVTKTTTTVTTSEILVDANSYRDDTQKIYETEWKPIEKWIYKIGSGITELDNLINEVDDYGRFFPMIPVRMFNEFIEDKPGWEDQYALAKRAYRKATDGGKYDDLVANIAESEDVEDMDFIYVVYGVSLNTIDNSARRYIYEFLLRLKQSQSGAGSSSAEFPQLMSEYADAYDAWVAWKTGTIGGPAPVLPPKPTLPYNEIRIRQRADEGGTDINYDIRLSWNFINEKDNQIGIGKVGAKKNDIWLEHLGTTTLYEPIYDVRENTISTNELKYDTMRIYWQYENNAYRYMDISGFEHRNRIFKGKSVKITAKEALEDGEESGFLIPLHYATYRAMRLIDSTQLGTASLFLVFNVYEKKKRKWWQSGFFQIIFVIVVAVISVAFTGGAGFGLLGAHMAVGAAFGLTGVTAAIAGSIANALAAMVMTSIISKLTEGMGAFGAIIGAVLGMVISGAMLNLQSGAGFTFNFADLMKVDNILKLMDAAGKGYSAYVQSSIADMQEELLALQESANAELRRVREAFFEQFGYGGGQIDPMMFVDNTPVIAESRDTFLARTLMTGSDVAQMSHDMLSDYVTLTTTLPNAFT